MRLGLVIVAFAASVAAGLVAATASPASGGDAIAVAPANPDGGAPQFTSNDGVVPLRSIRTIPYWASSFTDPTNGATYPFTMVGTDPSTPAGQVTTTVPTEIIPLKLKFVAGNQKVSALNFDTYVATAVAASMDASGDAASTASSPMFSPADFPLSGDSGVQYGDAIMREQFGKVGTDYHVGLGGPKILPTVTINVPQNQGVAVYNSRGVLVSRVDYNWFSAQLGNLLGQLHIDPRTLPVFLTHNAVLYAGNNYLACCVIGYHGASGSVSGNGTQAVQTYVYAAYLTPSTFWGFPDRGRGFSDIHAVSHEVSEWMADPFITNGVQPWFASTAPQYGCTGLLETGDPVLGFWFPLSGNPDAAAGNLWHPQDEVFLNWFARDGESPALAPSDGSYTFMGGDPGGPLFTSPATGCS
jgi:hypothetical protein